MRVLARELFELELPHLEDISEALAEVFSEHTGELVLGGISELTDNGASALGGFCGLKLSLPTLGSLEESTATLLAEIECDLLAIGTPALSDATLAALLGFRSGFLVLGLESLSPGARELLKERRNVFLPKLTQQLEQLDCIEDCTEHRKILHDGSLSAAGLDLSRWEGLPVFAAAVLGSSNCFQISLNGLRSISPESARALSAYKRARISLDGLTSLCEETAQALSSGSYDISLNGLKALSAPVARYLSRCRRNISLNGVELLLENIAREFRNSGGEERFAGDGGGA